jgi:uncharacterized protein (DUF1684 family)
MDGPKPTHRMAAGLDHWLQLSDYRRRVGDLYADVRSRSENPRRAWDLWRAERDALFAHHSQSALTRAQRRGFSGLEYFPYDPNLRFALEVVPVDNQAVTKVLLEDDGLLTMMCVGRVSFVVDGEVAQLSLYWILGYGGGLFLPFRDATHGAGSFGGGRYLMDTIKGADLGWEGDRLILDFNFAYNPSCAYNPRWHCPLAPAENWLDVAIRAGEKRFPDASPDVAD